uniref:TNFAIP3 interacting protein 3 n=1 Tax=Xenopus tropicalis TaxID=8364 RepID=A0A803J431_XENTR
MELNTAICMQIQRNTMLKKGEDTQSVSKHQARFPITLCSLKILKEAEPSCDLQAPESECLRQTPKNSMAIEAYQQKIYMLEKQKAELLHVNRQWDQQFRKMKLVHETMVSQLKLKSSSCQGEDIFKEEKPLKNNKQLKEGETLNVELLNMKEENHWLRKQNALYSRKKEQYKHEINRLNQVLEAIKKDSLQKCQVCLKPTNSNTDYEELLTQNEVLKEQKKEMAHNNRRQHVQSQLCCLPTGKYGNLEPLAQNEDCVNRTYHESHKRHYTHHKTHVPDYQWYVPDQLPPDVQQKENAAKFQLK